MNLEDLEFAEGDSVLAGYISHGDTSKDNSIYMMNGKAYWRRVEVISDLSLRISTLAYGGTQYSGRKLYESSLILGKLRSLEGTSDYVSFLS
jgi:hypothetical protein